MELMGANHVGSLWQICQIWSGGMPGQIHSRVASSQWRRYPILQPRCLCHPNLKAIPSTHSWLGVSAGPRISNWMSGSAESFQEHLAPNFNSLAVHSTQPAHYAYSRIFRSGNFLIWRKCTCNLMTTLEKPQIGYSQDKVPLWLSCRSFVFQRKRQNLKVKLCNISFRFALCGRCRYKK